MLEVDGHLILNTHLQTAVNQWINCYASNAGTSYDSPRGRLTDSQCYSWGSEVIVTDGVTTTEKDGHRAKDFRFDGVSYTRQHITLGGEELVVTNNVEEGMEHFHKRRKLNRNAGYAERVRRGTRCWIIDAVNKSSEEILLGHLTNLMAKV